VVLWAREKALSTFQRLSKMWTKWSAEFATMIHRPGGRSLVVRKKRRSNRSLSSTAAQLIRKWRGNPIERLDEGTADDATLPRRRKKFQRPEFEA
jgi:hypothetical protein